MRSVVQHISITCVCVGARWLSVLDILRNLNHNTIFLLIFFRAEKFTLSLSLPSNLTSVIFISRINLPRCGTKRLPSSNVCCPLPASFIDIVAWIRKVFDVRSGRNGTVLSRWSKGYKQLNRTKIFCTISRTQLFFYRDIIYKRWMAACVIVNSALCLCGYIRRDPKVFWQLPSMQQHDIRAHRHTHTFAQSCP